MKNEVDTLVYHDLNLDEVAMIIHTYLKKQDRGYETMVWVTEKVSYDILSDKDPDRMATVERYTLYIITSYDALTALEISEIFRKMYSSSLKKRKDK